VRFLLKSRRDKEPLDDDGVEKRERIAAFKVVLQGKLYDF